MERNAGEEWQGLLNPVDRISEVLFGLIMAVTIVGSLSIATAGQTEARAVTVAALGCNIAWGLVDAVMYLVRTLTERKRNRTLGQRIRSADADTAHRLIVQAIPEHFAAIVGPDEIEGMRRRLLGAPYADHPNLRLRDYLEAVGIFALVVIATFPVVVPFLLTQDLALAMTLARAITVVMLFVCGVALGRYAGHEHPLRSGLVMAVFGVVLIGAVKALGG